MTNKLNFLGTSGRGRVCINENDIKTTSPKRDFFLFLRCSLENKKTDELCGFKSMVVLKNEIAKQISLPVFITEGSS